MVSIGTAILVLGCGVGVSGKFKQDLEKFVVEASRLNALTEQGVNHEKFGDQLATVTAAD